MAQHDESLASFQKAIDLDLNYYPAPQRRGRVLLNKWLVSGRTDTAAREAGITALHGACQVKRDQPEVIDLLTRYGQRPASPDRPSPQDPDSCPT